MMKMRFQRVGQLSREAILLWGTAVLVALAVLFVGIYVVQKHWWAKQTLEDVGPRYERLSGVLQSKEQLTAALAQGHALVQLYAYPADREVSQVAADVQQKLGAIFKAEGVAVVSSQAMPERGDESLRVIPVTVRATGDLDSLRRVLTAVSEQRPAIALDSLSIQVGRKSDQHTPVQLEIQATFSAWRAGA